MIYRIAWLLFYWPVRLAFRLDFVGRERVPSGPCVISGNHVSYLDPIVLAFFSRRQISYMAKAELFAAHPLFGWAIRQLRAFPVMRGTPDRNAITEATRRLEAGGLVGIFPEGTRSRTPEVPAGPGEVGEAYGGAAMIALRSGVPLVPVGIHGTAEALPRGRKTLRFVPVRIVFGEPVRPEDVPEGSRRERVDGLTAILMERIADAVAEAAGGA